MGKKSQVRIVAEVDDNKIILASIREATNGTLILSLSKARFHFLDGLPQDEVVTQKFTFHLSPRSHGTNTIHHTLVSKGMPNLDSYVKTSCIYNARVEAIYVQTMREVKDEFITPALAKDTLITLCQYLPKFSILHFVVFVAPQGATEDFISPSDSYNVKAVHFKKFTLIFVYAFSLLPSNLRGFVLHLNTLAPKLDGKPISDFTQEPTPGLSPDEAKPYSLFLFAKAQQQTIDYLRATHNAAPSDELDALNELALIGVRKRPYIPSDYKRG